MPDAPGRPPSRAAVAAAAVATLVAPVGSSGQDLARDVYRRSPMSGPDPLAHVLAPRGSLGFHAGGTAANSALTLDEIGSLVFLAERDSLLAGDVLDALGLVPRGEGVGAGGTGRAALRVGVPLAERWTVGASVGATGWGAALADDDAVALLRDGNAARSEFGLGRTQGDALLAADVGAQAAWRAGRILGRRGPELTFAAGLRWVRPLYYGRARSLLDDGGRVRITRDSVRADVAVATAETPSVELQGSGVLADALARARWPRAEFAVEASLTGLGTVSVDRVLRRSERVELATTRLDSVVDVVEGLSFGVRDTVEADVSPPAELGLAVSTWTIPAVQLDARLTAAVGGDFRRPPASLELLSTFRPVPSVPLRAGLRVGGDAGVAYRVGAGWEGDRFFARLGAATGGGWFGAARGVSADLGVGVWF